MPIERRVERLGKGVLGFGDWGRLRFGRVGRLLCVMLGILDIRDDTIPRHDSRSSRCVRWMD